MTHIDWEIASTGSHIVREGDDKVLCTVYQRPEGVWRVVVNVDTLLGDQPHFPDRYFFDLHEAKRHAEELLPIRNELEPTPISLRGSGPTYSAWREQKTRTNGQPTYGRKAGRYKLSVKCAASGMWYYLRHGMNLAPKPQGWFRSANEAMAAADKHYGAGA
jgi:hypothetical protein